MEVHEEGGGSGDWKSSIADSRQPCKTVMMMMTLSQDDLESSLKQ